MLKKIIISLTVIIGFVIIFLFLIEKFFFKAGKDIQPEISNFKESRFKLKSKKPLYFKVDHKLYYSATGELSFNSPAISNNDFEQAFVSPNGKYILIFNDRKLTLLDNTGKQLFDIKNCTGFIPIQEERKTGRFLSCDVQWGRSSDYFLILQDRVWDNNFSKFNKSTIYKYFVADNSFKPLISLDEEVEDCFATSVNEKDIYYQFATKTGGLEFKKVNISTGSILKEYHRNDSLRNGINADSLYYNYNRNDFDGSDYILQNNIVNAAINYPITGLYIYNPDTIICVLKGMIGRNAFKGTGYDWYKGGYFLPGNDFFIANVYSKNFDGQIAIDIKNLKMNKLSKSIEFYFNINSNDCKDFVFRYGITPNIKFATSLALKIQGK